jgi:hypothetical protein
MNFVPQPGIPFLGPSDVAEDFGMSIGFVLTAYKAAWRVDLRDLWVSERQPVRARVIGPIFPPEHRPNDGTSSLVVYGFFGGRMDDAWCVPVLNSTMTNAEREANAFFMRLLGVTVRIGKLNAGSDDVVYEVSGGNAIVRVNVTTGNVYVQGADGSAKIEILVSGKITVDAKGGMTVEVSDGAGNTVALATNADLNDLRSKYTAATYPVAGGGSTGTTSQPAPVPYDGTSVLKAK